MSIPAFIAGSGLPAANGPRHSAKIVWGITDGSAGMVAQVKALAAAMELPVEIKTIRIRKPWVLLPNAVYASPFRYLLPRITEGELLPPWPDIVISCGRKGALAAMGLRRRLNGAAKFIHIQDPRISANYFDLVIAMGHDRIRGRNVIKSTFALHAITPQALNEAKETFAGVFHAYPAPRIAVMIGGSTNRYTLTKEAMAQIIMVLQDVAVKTQGSLLITASRRTGEDNAAMLRQAFAHKDNIFMYDGVSESPYMGMLAWADSLMVTNDSVNMMSEAHATGKPLYLLPLPGHNNTKPSRFADMLIQAGIARAWHGKLEQWHYGTGNEMQQLARTIRKKIA